MSSVLFSPLTLRSLGLENRIVVSPMAQFMADESGNATDWHLMHLGTLAVSGSGLLITEATAVEPRGANTVNYLGLWSDSNEQALKRVVDFCRRVAPIKLGVQLHHAGRKASVNKPWEAQGEIRIGHGGWAVISASNTPYPGRSNPVEVPDEDGLARIKKTFTDAARRAVRIDFDLIELHFAHGYLLHSFLSPLTNLRQDRYGGDLEGRMRFPLEVYRAVREVWPEERPLGVRISATDWIDGGWNVADSVVFARELKGLGCDYIAASSGGLAPEQKITVGPGYQVPLAERIRRDAGVVTIAVGLLHEPKFAESVLVEGKADLIALGRGMLANPRWPWRAAEILGANLRYPLPYARCHPSMLNVDFFKQTRLAAEASR
jgi:2,4-dienoyl-CoA reductase-like NADH-dependent reductase (Old Yellow Enzyme family)